MPSPRKRELMSDIERLEMKLYRLGQKYPLVVTDTYSVSESTPRVRGKNFSSPDPGKKKNYNTDEEPQRLISIKKILLIGAVLVGVLLVYSVDKVPMDDMFGGTTYFEWNPNLLDEILNTPTNMMKKLNPFEPPPPPVKVYKDIWEELEHVSLGAGNICDNQTCQDQINEIYTRTDCEPMIKEYKDGAWGKATPVIAKQILDVCWDEYHIDMNEAFDSVENGEGTMLIESSDWSIQWLDNGYTMILSNYTSNEIGIRHFCSEQTVFESCERVDGIEFNADGTKLFVLGDEKKEYSCSIDWDVRSCLP